MDGTNRLIQAGQTVRDLCLQETGGFDHLLEVAQRLFEAGALQVASLDAAPSGVFAADLFADLVQEPVRVNGWRQRSYHVCQGRFGGGGAGAMVGIGFDQVGINNVIL